MTSCAAIGGCGRPECASVLIAAIGKPVAVCAELLWPDRTFAGSENGGRDATLLTGIITIRKRHTIDASAFHLFSCPQNVGRKCLVNVRKQVPFVTGVDPAQR